MESSEDCICQAPRRIYSKDRSDLRQFDLQLIAPGHCTGWRALNAMSTVFGEELVPGAVARLSKEGSADGLRSIRYEPSLTVGLLPRYTTSARPYILIMKGHLTSMVRDFDDNEFPLAYFISFRTYGTWLHGDERCPSIANRTSMALHESCLRRGCSGRNESC